MAERSKTQTIVLLAVKLCTVKGDCPLRHEVLMTLSGEGGTLAGMDCEGDGTANAAVDPWYVKNRKAHSMIAVWRSNLITNKFINIKWDARSFYHRNFELWMYSLVLIYIYIYVYIYIYIWGHRGPMYGLSDRWIHHRPHVTTCSCLRHSYFVLSY